MLGFAGMKSGYGIGLGLCKYGTVEGTCISGVSQLLVSVWAVVRADGKRSW